MRTTTQRKIASFILLMSSLAACSDENGPIGTGEQPIAGTAQKGPYTKSSEVLISQLNELAQPISSITTHVRDNMGTFSFKHASDSAYSITIIGTYFDEFSNRLSEYPLIMKAFYYNQTTLPHSVSINILTHLIYDRIEYLILMGLSPSNAVKQAQDEMISLLQKEFYVAEFNRYPFEQLELYNRENGDEIGNAILLYVTILANHYAESYSINNGSTGYSEALNQLASQFSHTGSFYGNTIAIMKQSIFNLPLVTEKTRANLATYSELETGSRLMVADISQILDIDKDGLTNDIDNDDDGDGIADEIDEHPLTFNILTEKDQLVTARNNVDTMITLNFNIPESGIYNIHLINMGQGLLVTQVNETNTVIFSANSSLPPNNFGFDYSFAYTVSSLYEGDKLYYSDLTTVHITFIQ